MRTSGRWSALLGAACGLLLSTAVAAADVIALPPLTARVTDLTGTLDATQRGTLENKFAALEQRKGAQLAVLLVPTTQPETIEQFAVRAFELSKLGREKVDDGVLLVVAKADRKVRIEVGYGLEGAIPDLAASRIINEYLTPHFREGNYYTGIDSAADALIHLVDGEALPEPYQPTESVSGRGDNWYIMIGFWAAVILNFVLYRLQRIVRSVVVSSLLFGLLVLLGAGFQAALFGSIVCAVAMISLHGRSLISAGSGGWSSGGGFGSGGGFSSGGGGGFSGGGGSSGGGGASGSW
ncbi:MAG: YgcG family protein [Tahibacter sp.]